MINQENIIIINKFFKITGVIIIKKKILYKMLYEMLHKRKML